MVYHQPAGVCGLIPTWNFPFFVTVQKIGPALADRLHDGDQAVAVRAR